MADKLPFLSDEFHFAIASVAARSAQMEHHIELAIAQLLQGKDNTARFVLKNLGQDRIVKFYQALLLDEFPEDKEAIDALISLVEDLRRERNEILHWLWGKTDDASTAVNATLRPFRDEKRKYRTAADIGLIADGMLSAVGYMTRWMELYNQRNTKSWLQKLSLPVPPNSLASALAMGQQEIETPPRPQGDSSQQ
jgi:hypothetical protein